MMMEYYPEIINNWDDIPAKQFKNEKEAIDYFQAMYGEDLMAVILDNDPTIKVVWEKF